MWALNASTRKARMASSTATETIVPVVTSKTSEVGIPLKILCLRLLSSSPLG